MGNVFGRKSQDPRQWDNRYRVEGEHNVWIDAGEMYGNPNRDENQEYVNPAMEQDLFASNEELFPHRDFVFVFLCFGRCIVEGCRRCSRSRRDRSVPRPRVVFALVSVLMSPLSDAIFIGRSVTRIEIVTCHLSNNLRMMREWVDEIHPLRRG